MQFHAGSGAHLKIRRLSTIRNTTALLKNFEHQDVTISNTASTVSERAAFELAKNAQFEIRDTKEALNLSSAIASLAASPDKVSIAILELIMNAIEHGNLCIGYELKKKLSMSNELDEEIEKRMQAMG